MSPVYQLKTLRITAAHRVVSLIDSSNASVCRLADYIDCMALLSLTFVPGSYLLGLHVNSEPLPLNTKVQRIYHQKVILWGSVGVVTCIITMPLVWYIGVETSTLILSLYLLNTNVQGM